MSVIIPLVLLLPAVAALPSGRGLPRGEMESALIIEEIFTSPKGEVQITRGSSGRKILLRNKNGALLGLREISGSLSCDDWVRGQESKPENCLLIFQSESEQIMIRSDEMEKGSLFHTQQMNGVENVSV